MSFQSLRNNSPIYILYKEATPRIEIGSATSVSAPAPRYPNQYPYPQPYQGMQMQQQDMIVDIVALINGASVELKKLPASSDVAVVGNMVITCSRDAMNAEISVLRQQSVDALNMVENHKSIISGCDQIIGVLNPEIAEQQNRDRENAELKSEIASLRKLVERMLANDEKTGVTLDKKSTENENH